MKISPWMMVVAGTALAQVGVVTTPQHFWVGLLVCLVGGLLNGEAINQARKGR